MGTGGRDNARALQLIHDLRNELVAVLNYAHRTAADVADRPDVAEALYEIETAGQRAADLASELAAVISAEEPPTTPR